MMTHSSGWTTILVSLKPQRWSQVVESSCEVSRFSALSAISLCCSSGGLGAGQTLPEHSERRCDQAGRGRAAGGAPPGFAATFRQPSGCQICRPSLVFGREWTQPSAVDSTLARATQPLPGLASGEPLEPARVAQRLLGGGEGLLGRTRRSSVIPASSSPLPRVRFVLVPTAGGLEVGGDSVQAAGQPERTGSLWSRKTPASTAARRCG